jgi:hypothetical protein
MLALLFTCKMKNYIKKNINIENWWFLNDLTKKDKLNLTITNTIRKDNESAAIDKNNEY